MIVYEGTVCPPGKGYVAIVVSKFNKTITERLLEGALQKLKEHKVGERNVRVCWVPGAFELPLLAKRFAGDVNCAAVICLGAVIKGETPHDEHINRAVSLEIARIATDELTPVIFGLLTCNTVEQAEARSGLRQQSRDKVVDPTAGNKGAEAAETALEMIDLLTEVPDMDEFPGMEMLSGFVKHITSADPDAEVKIRKVPYEEWLKRQNENDDEGDDDEEKPPKRKNCKKKKE